MELFPDYVTADPTHLARRGDPATSREAADAITASLAHLHKWAADCVAKSPGLTARELALEYCPTDPRKIGRRLNECEDRKLIVRGMPRRCTVSGRNAETWWPVKAEGTSDE